VIKMNNPFNRKLSELLGKMDDKMLQAKINAGLEMLKKGDMDEIAKKLNKVDKEEFLNKLNDFDQTKIKELNINIDDIKKNINETDLQKISQLIGEHGDEIVKKIKTLLDKS